MLRGSIFEFLSNRILQTNALPLPTGLDIDLDQLQTSLHSAWATETLLLMTKLITREEELLRLSNNWDTIQVYYIFYHCTQALHIAKGHPRPQSHQSTQNIFQDYWTVRSLLLPPWSLAFGASGATNAPPEIIIDITLHPWSACVGNNTWNLAAKALKTTREEIKAQKLREKREFKQRQKRQLWRQREADRLAEGKTPRREPHFSLPMLNAEEKRRVDMRLRPYTVMDYLYRLRLKTNYEDSDMFTDGPEDRFCSRVVQNAFFRLASCTLFLHELAIRNLIGRDTFLSWTDEWIQRNLPQNADVGLASRRAQLES
jgi:hypothetical protein